MNTSMGLTEAEREVVALLESALEKVKRDVGDRRRVAGHIEAALKCFHGPREGIPPDELNSANDG